MFSYFFDTTPEPEEAPQPPPSRFAKVNKTVATNINGTAEQSETDKYKIDPGYYFKHLDPKQIENVLTNFNSEIQTS